MMPLQPGANPSSIAPQTLGPQLAPVAVLLPLTGPRAGIGGPMLNAVRLAMQGPGMPPIDPLDTGGTPQGALVAAQTAIARGDRLIIGPLTAPETAAIAPVTTASGIPVLALTSDFTQARPGVWVLGLTPFQQVHRLVAAAQASGKAQLAALLPENDFGRELARAYTISAAALHLPPPLIRRYTDIPSAAAALHDLTHPGATPPQTPPAPAAAPTLPFDTLLLAANGERLQALIPLLAANGITPQTVRILGPALWAPEAPRLGALAGAWYAAPDPALRQDFAASYRNAYHMNPPALADLTYDAGGLARVTADSFYSLESLTRADGFSGTDGVLQLLPNGRVKRGLALFELAPTPQLVQPSPTTVTAPGV